MGWVLLKTIALVINLSYVGHWSFVHHHIPDTLDLLSMIVPIVGGLVVGAMARYGSAMIRGHGIPEAMEVVLEKDSRIPPRVAILKPLASAISIGTGGPFGAEGPIIVTGAALGSTFGQLVTVSPGERKTLLACGAAAGMTVIFGTPLAAVLLAVELLLFEWKPRSLIPVAIAAAIAEFWRPLLIEKGLMFPMPTSPSLSFTALPWCLVVGLLAGFLAILLTRLVYGFESLFHRLPLHWMWWPAIAGIGVGVGGWLEPRALGVGYRNIRGLLNGRFTTAGIARLFVGKSLIWSLALGSGTAGGTLAPLVMVGAAAGRLVGTVLPGGNPELWALLMMAGVMAAAMRAPLTAALFGYEVTGNAHALVGLLLVSVVAHLVGVLFLERSIMTEKLAGRGRDVRQELDQDPFTVRRVRDVLAWAREHEPVGKAGTGEIHDDDTKPVTVAEEALVSEAIARMAATGSDRVIVVDHRGEACGILEQRELLAQYVERASRQRRREPPPWLRKWRRRHTAPAAKRAQAPRG